MNFLTVRYLGQTLGLYDYKNSLRILVPYGTGISKSESDFNSTKDKMVNVIISLNGTLQIDENISLSAYFSCLIHVRREITFDDRTQNNPLTNNNVNLFTSSSGITCFSRN